MGTPDFSVGTLEALAEAGHEVVLAVTQPDKPKGRGGKMPGTFRFISQKRSGSRNVLKN